MLILTHNKGFKWFNKNDCFFKGVFFYKGKIYEGINALNLLLNLDSYHSFINTVKKLNGIFVIINIKENETWLAVDRARSIPIFLTADGKYISDSAEEIRKKLGINISEVNLTSFAELLLSRNTSSGYTLYDNIIQLSLGQTAIIRNNTVERSYYFKHIHSYDYKLTRKELLNQFTKVTEHIFDRLISSFHGRRVVLPLSGGYDSRLIATMLKKKKYENVICYTYGNKEDYEVKFSKKVAEKLGYEWHYISYTQQMWREFFMTLDVLKYFDYSTNHCTLPHIQEFMALAMLKENNIIDEDCIIVTGFCGDLPAGGFIRDIDCIDYSLTTLVETIFKEHYVNTNCTDYYITKIKQRIREYLLYMEEDIVDYNVFISQYESWFTAARPSSWVVNSNRVYEFFGMEWRLPLWDNEFLEFWYNTPNEFRKSCELYREWLFNNLFIPYGVDMKKPSNVTPIINLYKQRLKEIMKKLFIFIGMNLRRDLYKRNNINNYNEAAISLFILLETKKAFGYNFLSVHQLVALWWCEYKYGARNVLSVIK